MDAHAVGGRALTRITLAASPRGPVVVSAVLAAALGWQLAGVTWRLLPEAGPAAPIESAEGTAAAPEDRGDGAAVSAAMRMARMHLFGAPPANDSAPAVTEAPETNLDLALTGLFVAGDGAGSAIIAVGGGAEDVYTVGDTVVGDTTITAIRRDGVIIERGGNPERLRMEGAPANKARSRPSPGGPGRAAAARQLRQRFLENPASLPRNIRFEPAVREGELVGYRLASRTDDISLRSVGLEPSDVVTSVNGVPLNDPRQANGVLSSLRDAHTIEISFLRRGDTRSMSIPIGAPG